MANGQPTRIGVNDAMRDHLSTHFSDAQIAVEALGVSLEVLANAGAMPRDLMPIAIYVSEALADLKDRVERHLDPIEVDHAA